VSVRDARTKGRGRGTEGAGGCCTDRRKGDSLSRVLWVERRLLGLGRGSMELLEMRGERPERSRAPDGGGGGRRAARQQPMHIAGPDASTDALRRSGPSCSCSARRSFSTLFTRSYEVETAWGQGLAVRRRDGQASLRRAASLRPRYMAITVDQRLPLMKLPPVTTRSY
jgi:hypothetical protein